MMSFPQDLCQMSMRHKETVLSHNLVKVLRCGEVEYDWSASRQKGRTFSHIKDKWFVMTHTIRNFLHEYIMEQHSVMSDIPEDLRTLIIDHHKNNLSIRAIANIVNHPKSTVADIVKHYKETGKVTSGKKGRCGRNKKLSPRTERALARESKNNPLLSARQIKSEVLGSLSSISTRTVSRSLRRQNRIPYRPVKAPSLTPAQKKVRLQWCRQYQSWTVENWQKVTVFFSFLYKNCLIFKYSFRFFTFLRFFSQMRLTSM